jgi:Fe-S cluster assembly iron-binding protein IscA
MFEVTEKASGMIKIFLENNKGPQTIRLLMQAGCGGAALGMALDEPKEKDLMFTDKGITFAVDKDLFENAKPIGIDFVESVGGSGFKISSSLLMVDGCDSCCGC